METMNAAVVRSFDHPPRYETTDRPQPQRPDQFPVRMRAAALHPRVRSGAAGRHYTSSQTLPLVPGVDGVGQHPDGRLLYVAAADDVHGTMADWAVTDWGHAVELPDGADPAAVAATVNPALSSWMALRRRAPLRPGQNVLVLGATGCAGAAAVAVARQLGAGRVIGVGRDPQRLRALTERGADEVWSVSDEPDAAALGAVDVVLDYLWGEPAQRIMAALPARRSGPLHWVEIGAMAGPTLSLPAAALRSTDLRLVGAGQGSIGRADYLAELPALLGEIAAGTVTVPAETAALRDVEAVWERPEPGGVRTVLQP